MSRLMEKPAHFLGSCLVALNIFLVLYGLFVAELTKTSLWIPFFHSDNAFVKLIFDIFCAWLILVLFGEFLARAIFRSKSDSLTAFFAPVSGFFYDLFSPIAAMFVNFSESILKYLFNVRIRSADEPFALADIDHFLQEKDEQDEVSQELNKELLQNALSLPALKIRQCLVPRTEIEAVDISNSIESLRKKFEESKLSKIIIFEGNIDNILGYVHQLDLFKKPSNIRTVIHPIPVVPESMSATDLINKFTRDRRSIAWVIDEFGGTAGIITMEDVLEEIFGDIRDEYDTEEFEEKKISENEFIFSGRLELDYLNDKYAFDFPESESETLSGYIINRHETIPKPKERIIIDKYEFDILNVSETRIDMVKMKILQ